MTDTTVAPTSEPPNDGMSHKAAGTPMQKIIAISSCVVLFRLYVAVFESSDIIHWQVSAPRWVYFLLPALSIVVAVIAAKVATRWFDRFISILIAAMFGAAVTLPISSIPGAALGTISGGIVLTPLLRRLLAFICGIIFKMALPVFIVAMCAGFAASTRRGIWPEQDVNVMMSVVIAGLVLATCGWTWLLSRRSKQTESDKAEKPTKTSRIAHYVLGTICAFAYLSIGWIVGLEIDNHRVHARLTSGTWVDAEVGPMWEWPFKGLYSVVTRTWIWEGATDDDLMYLKRYDQISEIHCRLGRQITAQGTSHLGEMPIKILRLEGSDDDRNGFLQDLSNLAHLTLSESKTIGDKTISFLECERTLQGLYLSGTNVMDAGMEHLKDYSSLGTLDLSKTSIGDLGVSHLRDLPLDTLDLSGTQVTGACVKTLKNMPMLMDVNLSDTAVEISDLKPLANLAKLAGSPQAGLITLRLRGQKVDTDDLATLRTLSQLRSLTIRDSDIDDAIALKIAGLPHVEIDVWNLSPTTAKTLKPTLFDECYFWVDNKHVAIADMKRLVGLGQEITFDSCTIDIDAIRYLVDAVHEIFSFQRCDFSEESLAKLEEDNAVHVIFVRE